MLRAVGRNQRGGRAVLEWAHMLPPAGEVSQRALRGKLAMLSTRRAEAAGSPQIGAEFLRGLLTCCNHV
jgi:hypothetical protein